MVWRVPFSMSRRIIIAVLAAVLTPGCSNFPRDPEQTLERVRATKQIQVGVVAGGSAGDDALAQALLKRLEQETRASSQVAAGETEPLLARLEEGDLDLVIGHFKAKSPWTKQVTLGPPLRRHGSGKREVVLAPVMANGENAWIALVERQARNVREALR
jgi:hypothetical protein